MNMQLRYLIFLILLLICWFFAETCHAQRINTPTGYEYHDRFFSVSVDSVQKHVGVIMYFRGKHYVTIKSGAYAIDHSRIYFGKRYAWKFEGKPQDITIEITGKHTHLKYRIK